MTSGQTIICGRYAHSGVAYSRTKGLGLEWCRSPDRGLIAPDLLIFLDIDPHSATKRSDYGQERYEKVEFQSKVRESFKELFEREKQEDPDSESRVRVVDATRPIDVIHTEIMQLAQEAIQTAAEGQSDIKTLWSS